MHWLILLQCVKFAYAPQLKLDSVRTSKKSPYLHLLLSSLQVVSNVNTGNHSLLEGGGGWNWVPVFFPITGHL